MKTQIRPLAAAVAAAITLSACGGGSQAPGTADSPQSKSATGTTTGGRAPIKGSTVTVYTVDNTTGARTTAASTTTTASGTFTVSFSCPATSQIYFESVGGDAGGGATNAAIDLINVSLPCATLANGFSVNIDEATTAAAAYALAGSFFSNTSALATSPSGIPAAFDLARSYADSTSGLTQSGLPGQAQTAINSLANSLAACVNSSSAGSAQCSNLFSAATVSGVTAPTTTLQAAIGVAYYPLAVDPASVYNAAGANTIYTPAFAAKPSDWSLQTNLLQDATNITYQSFTSDKFSWMDSTAQPRSAVLAHNDGGCTTGSCGGELRDFQYMNGGTLLDASAPTSTGDGGFGYVVSHPHQDPETGGTNSYCSPNPGDTSSLGHGYSGTYTRTFVGRHHSVFDFNTTYNRYCPQSDEGYSANCVGTAHGTQGGQCSAAGHPVNGNAMTTPWVIPVTIGWVFGTGTDSPIWSVTYDVAGSTSKNPDLNDTMQLIANGDLEDDTRAPYGVLLWDGDTNATSANGEMTHPVAGTAWGDGYDFTTTPVAGPLTLSSGWTWNSTASGMAAYGSLWTSEVDTQMGIVQTQTIDIQDAGGGTLDGGSFGTSSSPTAYRDYGGTTTVDKYSSCKNGEFYSDQTGGPGPNGTQDFNTGLVFQMPCIDQWPYQLNEFEFDSNSATAQNHFPKLAWGASYGFLGEQGYSNFMTGTSNYPNPGGMPKTIDADWHSKNYSTWIVLGQKQATDAVQNQVTQLSTTKGLTINASTGTVATTGPIGIKFLTSAPPATYPSTQTYSPAGYDPVLGALTFIASNNNLASTITVATGNTLKNPMIVLRGFTGTTSTGYPRHVVLDNVELVADKDYFPSLWTAQNQLWITLGKSLAAGSHSLTISN
jgi:hypothetical protein